MKPFNLIQISGPLYLSNKVWPERDLGALVQAGIGAIVNLVEDHTYTVPPPLVCLNCGFADGEHLAPAQLAEVYAFIDRHRRHTNVLVHCSAGVSRSAGILAGQLLREHPAWSWAEALAFIHARRSVWVSVETRASVLAYLGGSTAALAPDEIPASEAAALAELGAACGTGLGQVGYIGWNTRGYTVSAGRVSGLGLYNLGLTALPRPVLELEMLGALSLAQNRLEELPAALGGLASLQSLDLSGNRLAALPGEVGRLANLHELNAARNRLEGLPEQIQGLGSLERLYLHQNRLVRLPENLAGLANLSELYLQNNLLCGLPAGLGDLAGLRQLAINGNQLRSLPAALASLANLEALSLAHNQLAALPAELGRLGRLDSLNFSSNRLETLPAELAALRSLRRLNIALNPYRSLPPAVTGWLAELNNNGSSVIE